MVPRDTTTGAVLEDMVVPALEHGGYSYRLQADVGKRVGGGRHRVDAVAWKDANRQMLISLKWQQVSGTAEQKVPFEVLCLAEAILASPQLYAKAYLVLGGPGWKLRDFYVGGGLSKHLVHAGLVTITTLEDFVARANRGEL